MLKCCQMLTCTGVEATSALRIIANTHAQPCMFDRLELLPAVVLFIVESAASLRAGISVDVCQQEQETGSRDAPDDASLSSR